MKKRLVAVLLCVCMVLTLLPVIAFAEGEAVAKIGETAYSTLADAVAAAEAGQTVEIVAAGTYKLPNLPKNITVKASVEG
ncbi:MAG: hypothetical protein MJ118_06680, partial [Clostridia bacterium]|nr:hypothetical protein [Clostridia bacterium]